MDLHIVSETEAAYINELINDLKKNLRTMPFFENDVKMACILNSIASEIFVGSINHRQRMTNENLQWEEIVDWLKTGVFSCLVLSYNHIKEVNDLVLKGIKNDPKMREAYFECLKQIERNM